MQPSIAGNDVAATTISAGLPIPFAPAAALNSNNKVIAPLPPKLPPPMQARVSSTSASTDVAEVCSELSTDISCKNVVDIQRHNHTLTSLRTILKSLKLNSIKTEEIEKRLEFMSSMWLENRFEPKLVDTLSKLVQGILFYSTHTNFTNINIQFLAIENNLLNEATEFQRSLSVDYGSLGSQWGTILRQLIVAKQQMIEPAMQVPKDSSNDAEIERNLLVDTAKLSEDRLQHCGKSPVKGTVIHI